jgi:pyridoxamine 5'-phosphate oxidase
MGSPLFKLPFTGHTGLPQARRHGYHPRMSNKTEWSELLPDPLPPNPLSVAAQWLAQAQADAAQPNPNAMVLATVDAQGQPSARVVLCKEIDAAGANIVFHTNYLSRKGRELRANPRAALVFHWDHRHRQVRIEGAVQQMSDAENDEYFRTRPWQSRLGAWASAQSEPVASRGALKLAIAAAARRFRIAWHGPGTQEPAGFSIEIPRPPHWGGFRLRVDAIELWVEGAHRIHDRARWTRRVVTGAQESGWTATRLQP